MTKDKNNDRNWDRHEPMTGTPMTGSMNSGYDYSTNQDIRREVGYESNSYKPSTRSNDRDNVIRRGYEDNHRYSGNISSGDHNYRREASHLQGGVTNNVVGTDTGRDNRRYKSYSTREDETPEHYMGYNITNNNYTGITSENERYNRGYNRTSAGHPHMEERYREDPYAENTMNDIAMWHSNNDISQMTDRESTPSGRVENYNTGSRTESHKIGSNYEDDNYYTKNRMTSDYDTDAYRRNRTTSDYDIDSYRGNRTTSDYDTDSYRGNRTTSDYDTDSYRGNRTTSGYDTDSYRRSRINNDYDYETDSYRGNRTTSDYDTDSYRRNTMTGSTLGYDNDISHLVNREKAPTGKAHGADKERRNRSYK